MSTYGFVLWVALAVAPTYTEAGINIEQLGNLTYAGIYDHPVTLRNGAYTGEPFVPGGVSAPNVRLISDQFLIADFDDDGIEDAAVLLTENSGGSGTHIYLAIVTDTGGTLSNVATQDLGDRVRIGSITSRKSTLLLDMVVAGPGEPMCCPAARVRNAYSYRNGELMLMTVESAGQ